MGLLSLVSSLGFPCQVAFTLTCSCSFSGMHLQLIATPLTQIHPHPVETQVRILISSVQLKIQERIRPAWIASCWQQIKENCIRPRIRTSLLSTINWTELHRTIKSPAMERPAVIVCQMKQCTCRFSHPWTVLEPLDHSLMCTEEGKWQVSLTSFLQQNPIHRQLTASE